MLVRCAAYCQFIPQGMPKRVKYFSAEKTTILGKARVLATEKAQGKFLAFLDCDDLWLEDKLQKQIDIFAGSNEDLGLVYGATEVVFESNKNKTRIYRVGMELPTGKIFSKLNRSRNCLAYSD